ncbi:MAG TPA: phosphatase PAP2 family protein [Xanthobacteraceae bacterium]|nr:phosphatase PAP2 family protein [Xanthobacteraceae bacterium]
MNPTGLAVALAVAVAVGLIFGVFPWLDLKIAGLFFDPPVGIFAVQAQPWASHSRDAARGLVTLLSAPAFLAIFGKLVLPRRRMLIKGRAAVLLTVALALGPGILANTLLKDHWGRARPIDVTEFGGTDRFTPWWDPRGPCPNNCSFIAGEPSGAFWTLAPAALAPPQWRALAYAGALAFGAAISVLRLAAGAHFFTDTVFAGVFMFLLVWTLHGLIYRWRATRIADQTIEDGLAQAGEAMRATLAALLRRLGGGTSKSP